VSDLPGARQLFFSIWLDEGKVLSVGQPTNWQIGFAAHVIRCGGVIAYPTETVWGLGCDPENSDAIRKILALKQRPREKGLILVADSAATFEPILRPLSDTLRSRFAEVTQTPTSWLVPDLSGQVSCWVKGEHDTVALRVSSHPAVQALSALCGHPLVSTSANPAGFPPARSILRVRQYFADHLDFVLPGDSGFFERPSLVKHLVSGEILRS